MGLSSLFFSPAYVGCGILVLRRTSSRFGLSAQLFLLLCSVPENIYLSTLLSGVATRALLFPPLRSDLRAKFRSSHWNEPLRFADKSEVTHYVDLGMDECSSSISSAISINLRKEAAKALTVDYSGLVCQDFDGSFMKYLLSSVSGCSISL